MTELKHNAVVKALTQPLTMAGILMEYWMPVVLVPLFVMVAGHWVYAVLLFVVLFKLGKFVTSWEPKLFQIAGSKLTYCDRLDSKKR